MMEEFKIQNLKLKIENKWNIVESSVGYRFWPDKLKGEGFFLACFRKNDGEEYFTKKIKNKPEQLNKKEIAVIESWIGKISFQFVRRNDTVHAIPEKLGAHTNFLSEHLRMMYGGVEIGQIIRDKLIPDHSLSMSNLLNESIPSIRLDHDTAIEYLKKKEIQIKTSANGWQLVQFEGHNLGWINVLPNRINNYYPKELRILKES
jgi:NOL1/NOP2/fmu family ribosome biogenesis protein